MDLRKNLVFGFIMLGGVSLILGVFLSIMMFGTIGSNLASYTVIFRYGLLLLFTFWVIGSMIYLASGRKKERSEQRAKAGISSPEEKR